MKKVLSGLGKFGAIGAFAMMVVMAGSYFVSGPISPYKEVAVNYNHSVDRYANITAKYIEHGWDYCRVQQLYIGLTLSDIKSLGWYPCGSSWSLKQCDRTIGNNTGHIWHKVTCGTTTISAPSFNLSGYTLDRIGMRNSGYTNKYTGELTVNTV